MISILEIQQISQRYNYRNFCSISHDFQVLLLLLLLLFCFCFLAFKVVYFRT